MVGDASLTAPPSQLHQPKKCNLSKELLIITKTMPCCQWISALAFILPVIIVKLQFNETQILQAQRSNICKLNYPTCEAKRDYIKYPSACFGVHTRDFF